MLNLAVSCEHIGTISRRLAESRHDTSLAGFSSRRQYPSYKDLCGGGWDIETLGQIFKVYGIGFGAVVSQTNPLPTPAKASIAFAVETPSETHGMSLLLFAVLDISRPPAKTEARVELGSGQ